MVCDWSVANIFNNNNKNQIPNLYIWLPCLRFELQSRYVIQLSTSGSFFYLRFHVFFYRDFNLIYRFGILKRDPLWSDPIYAYDSLSLGDCICISAYLFDCVLPLCDCDSHLYLCILVLTVFYTIMCLTIGVPTWSALDIIYRSIPIHSLLCVWFWYVLLFLNL